ncbi:hypothetical protein AB986_03625 [Alkalihalobacillus macyae]|uniref:Uncharacterized protein n=1 Tax=Guptibacillus hwajinpoensis TaxID=208199 RepID=A0A0J6D275_9BACL|nr:hypothetical protein AB986_03625 [Alkalihalobacillus macyae]
MIDQTLSSLFYLAVFVEISAMRVDNFRSSGVSPVPLVPQESSILPLQLAKCGFYSIIVSNILLEKSLQKKASYFDHLVRNSFGW